MNMCLLRIFHLSRRCIRVMTHAFFRMRLNYLRDASASTTGVRILSTNVDGTIIAHGWLGGWVGMMEGRQEEGTS